MIVEVDKELEQVFPRYLKSREEDMQKIEVALAKKDFETLRQIGHKLAGNAAAYGLVAFGEMAKSLENASIERQFAVCRDLVHRMRSYLTDLEPRFV